MTFKKNKKFEILNYDAKIKFSNLKCMKKKNKSNYIIFSLFIFFQLSTIVLSQLFENGNFIYFYY